MFSLETLKGYVQSLKEKALVLWFARSDERTPKLAYVAIFFAVAYALSPVDLIPDFIPLIGRLDDMLILPGMIWLSYKLLPAEVIAESQELAKTWLEKEGYFPTSITGLVTGSAGWISAAWYAVQKFLL